MPNDYTHYATLHYYASADDADAIMIITMPNIIDISRLAAIDAKTLMLPLMCFRRLRHFLSMPYADIIDYFDLLSHADASFDIDTG